jgi:type II secretory pathway pseudopilin PulG
MTPASPGAQPLSAPVALPDVRGRARNALPTVVVSVVVIGVLAALLLPAAGHATRTGKTASCCSNLKQLWTMQANYRAQFGGRDKLMPTDTGSAFWVRLTKTDPPLIDESLSDIFDCPVSPEVGSPANCEYLGPSEDVNTYADGDPVGACDHGDDGIIVIRKSGDVMLYARTDPVAIAALARTRR